MRLFALHLAIFQRNCAQPGCLGPKLASLAGVVAAVAVRLDKGGREFGISHCQVPSTRPSSRWPSDRNVARSIASGIKWTDPSAMAKLQPLECPLPKLLI